VSFALKFDFKTVALMTGFQYHLMLHPNRLTSWATLYERQCIAWLHRM